MGRNNHVIVIGALLAGSLVVGCSSGGGGGSDGQADIHNLGLIRDVLETNADVAYAGYSDSVTTAQALKTALEALVADPTNDTLNAAKTAWLVSREPYLQTEAYRFRNGPIDDDPTTADPDDGPEGDINAWPLGEALIDYVISGTDFGDDQVGVSDHAITGVTTPITASHANANPTDNIIGTTSITIDEDLLANTATADDEHDVISGYHAIEFLLWGQDLGPNGEADLDASRGLGAAGYPLTSGGSRPVTDFDVDDGECTSGAGTVNADETICARRGQYLMVAVDKLIADLTAVRDQWEAGVAGNYRDDFTTVADISAGKARLLEILTGMGTLSEGELAGERMQIALSADSQEDEHSCFSDNTHRDIVLDAISVSNMYYGVYAGYDSDLDGAVDAGTVVDGYGLDDYLRDIGMDSVADGMVSDLDETETGYTAIDALARSGTPFDNLIMDTGAANAQPVIDTILALNAQSTTIGTMAEDLELGDADDVVDPDASGCDTTNPTEECM